MHLNLFSMPGSGIFIARIQNLSLYCSIQTTEEMHTDIVQFDWLRAILKRPLPFDKCTEQDSGFCWCRNSGFIQLMVRRCLHIRKIQKKKKKKKKKEKKIVPIIYLRIEHVLIRLRACII